MSRPWEKQHHIATAASWVIGSLRALANVSSIFGIISLLALTNAPLAISLAVAGGAAIFLFLGSVSLFRRGVYDFIFNALVWNKHERGDQPFYVIIPFLFGAKPYPQSGISIQKSEKSNPSLLQKIYLGFVHFLSHCLPFVEGAVVFAGIYGTFITISSLLLAFGLSASFPPALPFVIAGLLATMTMITSFCTTAVNLRKTLTKNHEKPQDQGPLPPSEIVRANEDLTRVTAYAPQDTVSPAPKNDDFSPREEVLAKARTLQFCKRIIPSSAAPPSRKRTASLPNIFSPS